MVATLRPLWWHILWTVLLSEFEQIYLLPITVSLTEFFLQCDIKNLSFIRSWNQAPWVLTGCESLPDVTDWPSTAQSPVPREFEPQF